MKKTDDTKALNINANSAFLAASIALVTSSVLVNLTNGLNGESVLYYVFGILAITASLFTFIMTVKGFGIVNKSCRADEKNENYYMGRNLQILSVVSIVITAILTIVAFFLAVIIASYDSADSLTAADYQAQNNVLIIMAVVSVVMQIFDITLPYIIYLWKKYKTAQGGNNLALLTVIIMITQLVIAAFNSIYIARGSDNSFLSAFTIVLDVAEGLAMMIFFMNERKRLTSFEL